jgi:hypothetical protein
MSRAEMNMWGQRPSAVRRAQLDNLLSFRANRKHDPSRAEEYRWPKWRQQIIASLTMYATDLSNSHTTPTPRKPRVVHRLRGSYHRGT